MKFRSRSTREDPEINFIPLIDVLLVILIFLMVTTTYSRFAELQINLPTAEAGQPPERPAQLDVAVLELGEHQANGAEARLLAAFHGCHLRGLDRFADHIL